MKKTSGPAPDWVIEALARESRAKDFKVPDWVLEALARESRAKADSAGASAPAAKSSTSRLVYREVTVRYPADY